MSCLCKCTKIEVLLQVCDVLVLQGLMCGTFSCLGAVMQV